MRLSLLSVTLVCSLSACQLTTINADQQFTQTAESIVQYRQKVSPYSNPKGVDGYLLPNLSADFLAQQYQKKHAVIGWFRCNRYEQAEWRKPN